MQGLAHKRRDTKEHLATTSEMNQNDVSFRDIEQQRKEELKFGRNTQGAHKDSRHTISHPNRNMFLKQKGI